MALEEQLSNDLKSVVSAIGNLNKQLEISNQDKFKAPVPPSLDKVKIESQGPDMSDSKTVAAWKELVGKVVGPELQKSARTDPQRTLKSADQTRGVITDQLETLNKQYNLDTDNQKILIDLIDQYKLQADSVVDMQNASILNTDRIVSQLVAAQETDLDMQNASILNTDKLIGQLADQSPVDQSQDLAVNISDNIEKALLNMSPDDNSDDDRTVKHLEHLANLSEQQILALQNQQEGVDVMKEMGDTLLALVDVNEKQLLSTTDAEEARKIESQVVTQAEQFQLTSLDRDAQQQFAEMFKGIEGSSSTSMLQGDAKQMEEAGGSIISDIMSGAFTDLLADGVGSMLGKTGGWMKGILGKAFSITGKIFKPFVGAAKWVGTTAARGIKSGLSSSFKFSKKVLGKFFGGASRIGVGAAKGIQSGLGKAFSFASKSIQSLWDPPGE